MKGPQVRISETPTTLATLTKRRLDTLAILLHDVRCELERINLAAVSPEQRTGLQVNLLQLVDLYGIKAKALLAKEGQ